MSKTEIIEIANKLIYALYICDDGNFVEDVIDTIAAGNPFSAEEIEYYRGKE